MTEQLITMTLSSEKIILFAYVRNSKSLLKLAVVLTTLHCYILNFFTHQLTSYDIAGDYFQALRNITAPAALMVRQQSSLIITPE